jgi:hypothetical protein
VIDRLEEIVVVEIELAKLFPAPETDSIAGSGDGAEIAGSVAR